MLNLGCGTKMNWDWNNIDLSPSARLAHHMGIAKILAKIGFLSEERLQKLFKVDPRIIIWDLRKGIPFNDNIFDVVYHCHLLEHLDRRDAPVFLKECYRVTKPRGIIRVVVPDLQSIINRYISAISRLEDGDRSAFSDYHQATYDLFDQMVRKEPTGTTQQRLLVRLVERFLRGDAAKASELHRWMYDKWSLEELLSSVGFKDIRTESPLTSRIEGWNQFDLDTDEDGSIYKSGSLYIEGVKL